MRQDFPHYQRANVQVLVISHQGAKAVIGWLHRNPQPFPWLFDPERKVIKAYGLYNRISYDAFRMAHPAAVLIDKQGIIRFIYRCSTQWDVPPSNVMLQALNQLPV